MSIIEPANSGPHYKDITLMIKHILMRIKGSVEIFFQFNILKKRKLTIGSSKIKLGKEWILSEYDTLDASKATDWKRLFGNERLTNILAEHVWEHIPDEETRLSNQNCYDYLQKGGRIRIAVPDGNNPNKDYIEHVRVGGSGVGADDHKILYTYDIMKSRLEKAGFKVELLEYWDENGKFNYTEWTNEAGMIHRSRRYDPRNQGGKLGYTSLIVDGVKE